MGLNNTLHRLPQRTLATEVEERAAVLGRERADDLEHAANTKWDRQFRAWSTHIYIHAASGRARKTS